MRVVEVARVEVEIAETADGGADETERTSIAIERVRASGLLGDGDGEDDDEPDGVDAAVDAAVVAP